MAAQCMHVMACITLHVGTFWLHLDLLLISNHPVRDRVYLAFHLDMSSILGYMTDIVHMNQSPVLLRLASYILHLDPGPSGCLSAKPTWFVRFPDMPESAFSISLVMAWKMLHAYQRVGAIQSIEVFLHQRQMPAYPSSKADVGCHFSQVLGSVR